LTHDSGSREELLKAYLASYHPKDGTPVLPGHLDRATNWRAWCKMHEFYKEDTFKNMHTNHFRKFLFKRGEDDAGRDNVSCQVKTADEEILAFT
jgi:hypothetical protein